MRETKTGVVHLTANILYLIDNFDDEELSNLFDMDGLEARRQLQERLDRGDRLLPSEGCEYFDPQEGCRCRFKQIK